MQRVQPRRRATAPVGVLRRLRPEADSRSLIAMGAIRTVGVLGNHLPRQCGIATFTTHLTDAIAVEFPVLDCFVLAMNDGSHRHPYPARVRFEIAVNDVASYRRAADYLNVNAVDVVCVQHEYGIFGGKAGSHVLALLRELRAPYIGVAYLEEGLRLHQHGVRLRSEEH